MSTRAPAGSVNRKNGIEATVDISDRKKGDGVSILIIQIAAVSCAATQVPEITLATHKRLKTGFRKAIQVEVLIIQFNVTRMIEAVAEATLLPRNGEANGPHMRTNFRR